MMLKDRAGYELMKEKEMEDRARVEEEEERLGKWKKSVPVGFRHFFFNLTPGYSHVYITTKLNFVSELISYDNATQRNIKLLNTT